jgi:hypothetical protein
MGRTLELHNVEEIIGIAPKYMDVISRWLDNQISEDDGDVMMEIVETFTDDNVIIWPPVVQIQVEDGEITLSAEMLDIIAKA